jgi:ankyrin repeat protein
MNRNTHLHDEIRDGHTNNVKRMLGKSDNERMENALKNRNFPTHNKFRAVSAAELAAQYCQVELIEYFLHIGVDVNRTYARSYTMLHFCIGADGGKHKQVACVRHLLSHPTIHVNQLRERCWSPLHAAAQFDHRYEIVKLLLKHTNIDVNVQIHDKDYSPIMVAVNSLNIFGIRFLVGHKNINMNVYELFQLMSNRTSIERVLICMRQILNHENTDQMSTRVNDLRLPFPVYLLVTHGRL